MPATIDAELHGTIDGRPVRRWRLANGGVQVDLSEYGATILRLVVPDREGRMDDVVLGCASLASYRRESPYFGCVAGRYANRIAHARCTIAGVARRLAANEPPHHLHGGTTGFDKRCWTGDGRLRDGLPAVTLRYASPDGEEGYPGRLDVTVTYVLDDSGMLTLAFRAVTDAPTVVNLTGHTYWNLEGAASGRDVLDHVLSLEAPRYLPVDDGLIPTGERRATAGSPFDFATACPLGARIHDDDPQLRIAGGYDHTFVLDGTPGTLRPVARLYAPRSGRTLELATTDVGLQLYTGNHLDGAFAAKDGARYGRHAGVCLEDQAFPDAPNRPDFPSTLLLPGERYEKTTTYRFTRG